jgi:protein gp37
MGITTIEWCDYTFNPWIGCSKVAPGCANCYAERDWDNRRHVAQWGPHGTRVVTSEGNWAKPIKWNKAAAAGSHTHRPRVFCASLADVFEDWGGPLKGPGGGWLHEGKAWNAKTPFTEVDLAIGKSTIRLDDVRQRLFALIDATPHLDWLLLTKRPENVWRMWKPTEAIPLPDRPVSLRESPHPLFRSNVWLGTSVAAQEDADRNIHQLLKYRDLSPVLFVSAEPLLGPIILPRAVAICPHCGRDPLATGVRDHSLQPFSYYCSRETCGDRYALPSIDWVIAGGESGPGARPMHPAWPRSLRDHCRAAGVPFLFKQWGEYIPDGQDDHVPEGFVAVPEIVEHRGEAHGVFRVGKKLAGRLLDGREWNEFPEVKGVDVL